MLKERRTADMVRVLYYRRHGPGSRLLPSDLDPAQVAAAGMLHVTGITPALSDSALATVDRAVTLAGRPGCRSLDLNYRSALWPPEQAAAVSRDLAARADLVFAGDDEAELLGLAGDPADLARASPTWAPATPWSSWASGARWPPSTAGSTPSRPSRSRRRPGRGRRRLRGRLPGRDPGRPPRARAPGHRGRLRRLRRHRPRRLGGPALRAELAALGARPAAPCSADP